MLLFQTPTPSMNSQPTETASSPTSPTDAAIASHHARPTRPNAACSIERPMLSKVWSEADQGGRVRRHAGSPSGAGGRRPAR